MSNVGLAADVHTPSGGRLAHVSNADACAIYAIILGLALRRRKTLVDILVTDLSLKQDKAINSLP